MKDDSDSMNPRGEQPRPSWVGLLALFSIASFVESMYYGQMGAFTPLYLPRLGVAAADVPLWTGRVAAIAGLLGIPFLPLWGALADRYSRKPIIVRSFVANLLSGVVMLLSGSVWLFAAGRAIAGFSMGNSGLMMTTLSDRSPRGKIGFTFAVMNSAAPIGAFIGPLFGGPLVDRLGFPFLLGIDGALMLCIIVALSLGYHDPYTGSKAKGLFSMAVDSVVIVLRSPLLLALFAALCLLFAGWMLVMTYMPLAVSHMYHGNKPGTAIGFILGLGGLSSLLLGPAMGALADRFGHWRLVFIGGLLSALLWPLPMLARGLVGFALAWGAANGITSGVFAVSFSVLSGSAHQSIRGRVMSFAYLPLNLGVFAGPAIGSALTRTDVFLVFPAAGAITLLGVGMLAVAARLRMRPNAQGT
jgi:DHA1 family multidrug resistance protein-like MFS transporter